MCSLLGLRAMLRRAIMAIRLLRYWKLFRSFSLVRGRMGWLCLKEAERNEGVSLSFFHRASASRGLCTPCLGPPPALHKAARTIKFLSALSQQAALFFYVRSSNTYRIIADLSALFSLRKTPKSQWIWVTFSMPSIVSNKFCCWRRSWDTIGGLKERKWRWEGKTGQPRAHFTIQSHFKLHIFMWLRSTKIAA